MTEVVLNNKCMHCEDKECHDGEHFCNYAMQKNSFYKNPRLYKGLKVIRSPTYTKKEIDLFNKCSSLQSENERLKLRLKNFEENVTRIITNFWCWYVSGNHIRDLSAKKEGEKYANNFFKDLIQEADERG